MIRWKRRNRNNEWSNTRVYNDPSSSNIGVPISTSIVKLCFHSISDSLFPITGREIIFLIRSRISRGWIMLDNWVASTRRQWFLSLFPFVMPGSWPIEKTGRISNGSVSYSSLPFPYNTCQRSKISSIN